MENINSFTDKLIEAFDLSKHTEYQDLMPFKGSVVGFSVKRNYPDNIKFKPAVTESGEPENVALTRIICGHRNAGDQTAEDLIPIIIEISVHSKYGSIHYGYDYSDPNCPTKESLAKMRETPIPVSYSCMGDYYLDKNNNTLCDKKKKIVIGYDILNDIYEIHCNSTKVVKQFYWGKIADVAYLLDKVINLNIFILRIAFRKGFKEKSALFSYEKQDMITLEAKSLNIFGYEASKNVIVTYALIMLLLYTMNFFVVSILSHPFLVGIYNNAFLLLCFVLVSLPLLEHGGPTCMLKSLNLAIKFRYWCIKHSPLYKVHKI